MRRIGSGIAHSEMNANADKEVKFLQLWVFPKEQNITPRYEQKTFRPQDRINRFQTVVAPNDSEAVFINQDAWFSLGNLEKGFQAEYKMHQAGNGVYAFVLEGEATINDISLGRRDAVGVSETGSLRIYADAAAEILLIEVPMVLNSN